MDAITTAWQFASLAHDADPNTRKRALQVTAPENVWFEIVKEFPGLKRTLSLNKTLPVTVLKQLAADDDPQVRSTVARKRKLPPDVLEELASDIDSGVRLAVVFHPRCPRYVLERLTTDAWEEVASKARARLAAEVEEPQ